MGTWSFLGIGYLLTVLIETPVLIAGLDRRHSLRRKLFLGLWLNACSYPVVILVLPPLLANRSKGVYIAVAEIFAPFSECGLFWAAFGERELLGRRAMWRDFVVITVANLASFLIGEFLNVYVFSRM
ncbi:MAG TPA: hypothetical protein VJX67_13115 [Blastocatellia bacterium]|nr:hypothetical protein [Blastocatellia bacterium]